MMDSSYHELDDTKARARNLLTCSLCSQPYDDPRVLHCQHTFCCRCLQAYIDRLQADWTASSRSSSGSRLGSFHCPTCLVDVGLPSAGAGAFPVDRRIQNIKNLMVEEMMQDIARKLKNKLGNAAEQNNGDAAGADKTNATKHGSGSSKSDRGHHRSSRLGDIHESGSLEDDDEKLFERDTSYNSRNLYDTLPSSFGRQKPGYSSLREPKRSSRPRVDISTSFDDGSSRFERNIPRSQSATAGFGTGTSLHNGVSSSSRPSNYVEEKPKNSSPFSNMHRDDVGEPYSPIIGRNRSMYSSLRERRRRPAFDTDKAFNDPVDFSDRGDHASHYKEQDESYMNGRFGGKSTADDLHHLHNLHGFQSASDFNSSSSKFDAHPRMSRTSHSEPNWTEKMNSTTNPKHSKPHHNGNVSSDRTAEDHTKKHSAKGSSDQGHESKMFPPTSKRAGAGFQKISEDLCQSPTNSRLNNNIGEGNESDSRKQSKAYIPKTDSNTADSAKETNLISGTLNDDSKNGKSMSASDSKHDKRLNGSASNGDVCSTATAAEEEEWFSPTGAASSDDGGQSPLRSPTRTDSQTSTEDGAQSPQRTPTRLEPKESKFTRLSKFRKVTRSGRSASVSTETPNGAGNSAENSPISSPIMTRSKSVQEDTPGSLKKAARKRPPIFVGTPLNFNCTIFDQDGTTATGNDKNTEASRVKDNEMPSSNVVDSKPTAASDAVFVRRGSSVRENLMKTVVPESAEFVLETYTINSIEPVTNLRTDNNGSVVSEHLSKDGLPNRLLNYDREPVRRGSLHSPETMVGMTESQNPVQQTSQADATETEAKTVHAGEQSEVEQTPQQEMEDLCAALDELDALTLSACSEMEVVEEECARNESTSLDATAADVVRTVSNIENQKSVPVVSEISAEDEQQMIDDICNELLLTAEDNNCEGSSSGSEGLLNGDVDKLESDGEKPAVAVKDSEMISIEVNSRTNETECKGAETNSAAEQNTENSNVMNAAADDHPNGIGTNQTHGDTINDDDSVFVENVRNSGPPEDDQTRENRSPKIDVNQSSNTDHIDHTDDNMAEPDTGFVMPTGVAVLFDKSLVVADSGAGCLCLCNAVGSVEHRIVGLKPFSVAVAGTDEKQLIYVGDRRRKTVVIFDRYGCDVGQWGDNQFDWVCGVAALPTGDLAILDRSRPFQLGIYSPEGEFRTELGRHGNADDELCMAEFLTVDSHGRILVADSGNHRIKAFDLRSGPGLIGLFGSRGCGDGQLQWPKGVAVDARDNVLVADSRNSRLQAFAADGRPLCTVVRTVRSPYAISCVPPRTLAVTTYSVTGLSEFHLYDTASVESILQSS